VYLENKRLMAHEREICLKACCRLKRFELRGCRFRNLVSANFRAKQMRRAVQWVIFVLTESE
jgi:hypothetical protein